MLNNTVQQLVVKSPVAKVRILKELTSAAEILNQVYDKPEFIIDELIGTGLILLCGKPKVGKSWFALRMCTDIASGQLFLGKFKIKPSKVVYFALEDNAKRIQDRLIDLGAEHNLANILISNQLRAFDEEGFKQLEEVIKSNPEVKVYIIDTLQRIKPTARNKSTTDYEADYPFASRIQALALAYNIAIILVHHGRKNNTSNEFTDDVLGSTGITAAADIIIMLKRDAEEKNKLQLQVAGRDVERRTLSYIMDPETMEFKVTEDDSDFSTQRKAALQNQILKFLNIEPYKSYSPLDVAQSIGKSDDSGRASVRTALRKLYIRGEIKSPAHGKYCIKVIDNEDTSYNGYNASKCQEVPKLQAVTTPVTGDIVVTDIPVASVIPVTFEYNHMLQAAPQETGEVQANVTAVTIPIACTKIL